MCVAKPGPFHRLMKRVTRAVTRSGCTRWELLKSEQCHGASGRRGAGWGPGLVEGPERLQRVLGKLSKMLDLTF